MNPFKIILQILFPNRCLFCGAQCSDKSYKCEFCETPERPVVRVFNIRPGVKGKYSHLLKVYSPRIYTGFYRESLHHFKFRRVTYLAQKYAMLIDEMNFFNKGSDYITFVPMTKNKVRERGYNQAELLAKSLGKISKLEVKEVLFKVKNNTEQHTLKMAERKKNIKGIFKAEGDIKGRHIILVDDIVTTGSTICECARLLYNKGAATVTGICAADAQTRNRSEYKRKKFKIIKEKKK